MTITVNVTQEDLSNGTACDSLHCALAQAMSRVLGKPVQVWGYWKYADEKEDLALIRRFPSNVRARMNDFDRGYVVEPFEFDLEVAS